MHSKLGRLAIQLAGLCTACATLLLIAGRAGAAGPASVLPAASTVRGWKQMGAPKTWTSSNLFDHVDGEAQAIEQYAFSSVAYAEYAPAGANRPAITIDVYDMTNPLNAFGLFSSSDKLSGQPVAIGTEGVRIPPTGLNFWKGRYVVRISIVSHPDAASQAAEMALAKAAAAKITGPSAVPAGVRALPPGLRPRSDKFQLSNVAGRAFLKNAIVGDYPSVGQGAKLFICDYGSPAAAKAALGQYQAAMRSGTGMAPLAGVGSRGFSVVDRFQKNVVAAIKGKYLIGVVYARDKASAVNLVKQAVARVR